MKIKQKHQPPTKLNNNLKKVKKPKDNKFKNNKATPETALGIKLEKLIEQKFKGKKGAALKDVQLSNALSENVQVLKKGDKKNKIANQGGTGVQKSKGVVNHKKKQTKRTPQLANGNGTTAKAISKGPSTIDKDSVEISVKACLKDYADNAKDSKLLQEPRVLCLQFTNVKIPQMSHFSRLRFVLPHSLLNDTSDVCLFVRDEAKSVGVENTVEKYKELLKKHKITSIKEVLTFRQLKTDYKTYEMKKKLRNRFDYFIVDRRLGSVIQSALGSEFMGNPKCPVLCNVDMNLDQLRERIESALSKTSIKLGPNRDHLNCVIGDTNFPVDHITENILAVTTAVANGGLPGGWLNVRAISLRSSRGPAFPLYYSKVLPDEVPVPVVASNRPKAAKSVTDELSTKKNAKIRVDADGNVAVYKLKKQVNSDSEDDSEEEESEPDEEPTALAKPAKKSKQVKLVFTPTQKVKTKNNINKEEEDDDDEDDSDEDGDSSDDETGVTAETSYLKRIGGQLPQNEDDDEDDSDEDDDDDDDDDEEEESASDDDNHKVAPGKRKRSVENNSSPSKRNKVINATQKNQQQKNVQNKGGKKVFDTSLGQTWATAQKSPSSPAKGKPSPNAEGGEGGKKKKRNKKVNKHQRKANMKMKIAKKNKFQ